MPSPYPSSPAYVANRCAAILFANGPLSYAALYRLLSPAQRHHLDEVLDLPRFVVGTRNGGRLVALRDDRP